MSVRSCLKKERYDTSSGSPNVSMIRVRVSKGRHEHSWTARGCIIYFFLHHLLGEKCVRTTCDVFNLNVSKFVFDPPLFTFELTLYLSALGENFTRLDL